MSKNSPRQNAQTMVEWLKWFNVKYNRKPKKKKAPEYMTLDEEY
jgi:hypothetical protein